MPLTPYFFKHHNFSYVLMVWLAFTGLHTFIIYQLLSAYLWLAFIDAFISYLFFLLLSIGLWYFIRVISSDNNKTIRNFISLCLAGISMASVWAYGFQFIFSVFVNTPKVYNDFVEQSILFRVSAGVLLFATVASFYYMIIYKEAAMERLQRTTELEKQKREAELKLLKNQINPHFLFNALNSASALTGSEPGKAREMIIKLSDFLRYVVKNGEVEMPELSDELENIQRYISIEKIRFGDRLIYTENIAENALTARLPGMMLQPLFENAIKHGVYESLKPIQLKADFIREGGFLVIRIKNEMDQESITPKGKGTGLKNIRERLFLLFQRNDLLTISKTKDNFMVELRIPQ